MQVPLLKLPSNKKNKLCFKVSIYLVLTFFVDTTTIILLGDRVCTSEVVTALDGF